ncbi:MAG TPA: hypothetical protein VK970_19105 [Candidatus Methylacidiphilales bacterium]|nr:hypothetical protein [Candidatus Methylacidiphilales bacterium]
MHKLAWLAVSLLAFAGFAGSACYADKSETAPVVAPAATARTYKHLGPVEVLDNGVVTLGVALKIGRIVSYQRKAAGEANWLGVVDEAAIPSWHWNPYGGDRIWPTSQLINPQIYKNGGWDPVIDGQPWEMLKRTPTSIEFRSGLSPQLGIRVTRHIELKEGSADVLHTVVVEKLKPSQWPVHVWAVTGLRKDVTGEPEGSRYFLLDNSPTVPHPDYLTYKLWPETPPKPKIFPMKELQTLHVAWAEKNLKAGTYGKWIAFICGNSAFLQTVAYDSNALYLEASNLQVYMMRDRQVYEIETLSPTWNMTEGETKTWQIHWQLVDLPTDGTTVEARASFLKTQAAMAGK